MISHQLMPCEPGLHTYCNFHLREVRLKFGNRILTFKLCWCHKQLTLFPMAMCCLTSFGRLSLDNTITKSATKYFMLFTQLIIVYIYILELLCLTPLLQLHEVKKGSISQEEKNSGLSCEIFLERPWRSVDILKYKTDCQIPLTL